MAAMAKTREFTWLETDEPHATRRKLILEKHPEIKDLFGEEPLTLWLTFGLVAIQVITLYLLRDASWPLVLILSYVVAGTASHSLNLAVHELSHNLGFAPVIFNKILAVFANLGTGFPSAITFQRYHMEHHQFQGVDGKDVDIPSDLEVRVFTNSLLKFFWVMGQPLFYAVRPLIIRPKELIAWEIINWGVVLAWDFLIFYFFGVKSLVFLVLGTILGAGLHPCAGHFIAEHYQFVKNQETYSYYGFCNRLNFNVGYHNEHHDFPKVPWSKLPLVRQMAPEFYEMPHYTSYVWVIYKYITDPEVGPFSRIKRKSKYSEASKSLKRPESPSSKPKSPTQFKPSKDDV
jgi:sphingolipid delta-4 desaturase